MPATHMLLASYSDITSAAILSGPAHDRILRASSAHSPHASAGAAELYTDTLMQSASDAARTHHDVAIIGGGPAGLLAAKALLAATPGIDVKVFEAAPGYRRNLGAGVQIEVNGWRALHAVDRALAERMRSRGILITGSRYFDEAGGPLPFQQPPTDHQANMRAHGHTPVMVHWGDIRKALFEALPPGVVSFSSRVVGLTPGQPGGEPAVLELQVPEQEPEQSAEADNSGGAGGGGCTTRRVTADLVIAADGYYSRTKRMVFGASGPPLLPTFRDRVVWRALVSYPDADQMPPLLREAGDQAEAMWWLAEGEPPLRTCLVYPVNDNRFVWTCIAPLADIEAAGLPPWSPHRANQDLGIQQSGSVGNDPKARCMAVFRNHPPEVLELLGRTDPRVITEHGYYTHDVDAYRGAPDWVRGNVVVLGDAAHTGAPDGMGLNMAWEDVAVLAEHVRRAPGGRVNSSEVLDAYCAARLPRVRDIWSDPGLSKPRRRAAKLAAAFEPLGPDSSDRDRTTPTQAPPPASPPLPEEEEVKGRKAGDGDGGGVGGLESSRQRAVAAQ
ncbi:hypothetical protein PLESTF_000713100 [Pleodorina starrii]|nr:hypothetical protein PLESTM_001802000 [Pleodorina starrii]GLC68603.1 hypothetical protein PLESTF_000713100 [Pleodorina starrii]